MENARYTPDGDLIGKISAEDLMVLPHRDWFAPTYENYDPDANTIAKLKDLTDGFSVEVFLGTWCKDSHNQVPKFHKIIREAGFDDEKIKLIAVDRNKTTPEKLESGFKLTRVPTFIFYRTSVSKTTSDANETQEQNELNRIVETPNDTLEADMLKILTNQFYKPKHSE